MDLSASSVWWLIAGVLVAVELMTGSFYLLMLALGAAAGAVAAHLGIGTPPQVVHRRGRWCSGNLRLASEASP